MSYSANCLTLVFNEDLKAWMPPATYKAQIVLPVPGKGIYSLPLPGQSSTAAGAYSLWQHRALPADGPGALIAGYYGFSHTCSVGFRLIGTGPETTKMLDNLVLISSGTEAQELYVRTSENPSERGQQLISGGSIAKRNTTRSEGHTYITVEGQGKGKKHRGRWLELRLDWLPDSGSENQGRLLKVVSILRDSFR